MLKCNDMPWPVSNPTPIFLSTWHDCGDEAFELFCFVMNPPDEWNNGRPSWALEIVSDKQWRYLPVTHCPFCGEQLEAPNGEELPEPIEEVMDGKTDVLFFDSNPKGIGR